MWPQLIHFSLHSGLLIQTPSGIQEVNILINTHTEPANASWLRSVQRSGDVREEKRDAPAHTGFRESGLDEDEVRIALMKMITSACSTNTQTSTKLYGI